MVRFHWQVEGQQSAWVPNKGITEDAASGVRHIKIDMEVRWLGRGGGAAPLLLPSPPPAALAAAHRSSPACPSLLCSWLGRTRLS